MKSKIFLIAFLFFTGCSNVLNEIGKKDTPKAIYYEAKLKMNKKDYSGAITLMDTLDSSFLAQRDVALVYASAYSGRCGLDFVNFVNSLSSVSSSNIFGFLMTTYKSTWSDDSRVQDCIHAETLINAIGTYTQRTSDENVLMGTSSLTKIGTQLAFVADKDGDGNIDAGFDHCDLNDFPDEVVREIGSGMANAILSIAALGGGVASGALSDIQDQCAKNSNLNVFCTNTDPAAFSTNEVAALRALVASDEGIGACSGNPAACICP
ncbi:MAG: hypothetical protein H6623_04890 [Bdellovibrionaceae bacterium]|nr:hypothetical protein [Pseudobdellovibrionaceae bacterium]